jgi:hypothetical protein
MEEKNISEHESLLIIQRMIQTAKAEQKGDGIWWIIWGLMLFLASFLTVINLHLRWFNPYFFWNGFGITTIVIFLHGKINKTLGKKPAPVRTYTQELFSKLNIGFFISLMFIIITMNIKLSPLIGFPLLISLYAFWILIYGSAVNFKPSIIAAYITWAIGIGALFVHSFEWVMVMHGLAALVGYIIPGYIANAEFKKIHRKDKEFTSV